MFPGLTRDDVFRIETRRLWLRWPRAADAEAIVELAGEPAVAEMTARIPHPIDPPATHGFLIEARRANTEGEALILALAMRSAPMSLIGLISIEPDQLGFGPHLGYWLGLPHWGQGLMAEAAEAMIDAYFTYAGGRELTSSVLRENRASRRVLEKCGFAHEGETCCDFPARGGERLIDRYRLTCMQWMARRPKG